MIKAAPLLLAASVLARLAWTYLLPNGANFVDLHVYLGGAQALDDGTLYAYVYAEQTPDFPLPFTYPPFAALVFYPLSLLPFDVVALGWTLGVMAGLYGVVWLSQRILGLTGGHRSAMLFTAVGIWTEPLRSTFDYGQINVLMVLLVLLAVYTTRDWLAGLAIGVAAGIKLTPAIAIVYLIGVKRFRAALLAVATLAATAALSIAVIGQQARFYFTDLLGDAARIGPIGTSFNQSWRGGISRILGHDAGYTIPVLIALAITAVIAYLAWRALAGEPGEPDRLGLILVVSLFGLLLSPVSWTHHWVWLIPLLIWLIQGPYRYLTEAKAIAAAWAVLILIGVPWLLSFAQPSIWEIGRPWYLAWAGLVYIVATVATLAWIAALRLRSPGAKRSCRYRAP